MRSAYTVSPSSSASCTSRASLMLRLWPPPVRLRKRLKALVTARRGAIRRPAPSAVCRASMRAMKAVSRGGGRAA
eukprot:1829221-Prymnesium_polylepis.1